MNINSISRSDNNYSSEFKNNFQEARSFHQFLFQGIYSAAGAPWQTFKKYWNQKNAEIAVILSDIKNAEGQEKCEKFIEALRSKKFSAMRTELRKIFTQLSPAEQDEYLMAATLKGIETHDQALLSRCVNLLSLDELKSLLKNARKVITDAKLLAKFHKEVFQIKEKHQAEDKNSINQDFKMGLPYVINFFYAVINTLLTSTQFFELGREPESAWDASYQLQVYYQIFSIPLTILWTIHNISGNPIITTIGFAASLTVILGSLYAYLKWIQPAPSKLPCEAHNLTLEVKSGIQGPVVARAAEIDEIINDLVACMKGARKHPLVIGKTGVGKSEILKGVAYRIVKGDVPDELKGKQLFVVNAANLCEKGMSWKGISPLEDLRKKIGNHAKNIIIAFDEIHAAKEDPKLWTNLLSLFDTSSGSLPYCIAVTSEDKYAEIENEHAFLRRMSKLDINEATDAQTLEILQAMIQHDVPEIVVSQTMLKEIIRQSNAQISKDFQPTKAKNQLAKLLSTLKNHLSGGDFEMKKREYKSKLELEELALKSENLNGDILSSPVTKNRLDLIRYYKHKIEFFQNKANRFREKVEQLKNLKAQRHQKEAELAKMAAETLLNKSSEHKQFLFESYYHLQALKAAADNLVKEHGLKIELTMDMLTNNN